MPLHVVEKNDFERWQTIPGVVNMPLYTQSVVSSDWVVTLVIIGPLETHVRWSRAVQQAA